MFVARGHPDLLFYDNLQRSYITSLQPQEYLEPEPPDLLWMLTDTTMVGPDRHVPGQLISNSAGGGGVSPSSSKSEPGMRPDSNKAKIDHRDPTEEIRTPSIHKGSRESSSSTSSRKSLSTSNSSLDEEYDSFPASKRSRIEPSRVEPATTSRQTSTILGQVDDSKSKEIAGRVSSAVPPDELKNFPSEAELTKEAQVIQKLTLEQRLHHGTELAIGDFVEYYPEGYLRSPTVQFCEVIAIRDSNHVWLRTTPLAGWDGDACKPNYLCCTKAALRPARVFVADSRNLQHLGNHFHHRYNEHNTGSTRTSTMSDPQFLELLLPLLQEISTRHATDVNLNTCYRYLRPKTLFLSNDSRARDHSHDIVRRITPRDLEPLDAVNDFFRLQELKMLANCGQEDSQQQTGKNIHKANPTAAVRATQKTTAKSAHPSTQPAAPGAPKDHHPPHFFTGADPPHKKRVRRTFELKLENSVLRHSLNSSRTGLSPTGQVRMNFHGHTDPRNVALHRPALTNYDIGETIRAEDKPTTTALSPKKSNKDPDTHLSGREKKGSDTAAANVDEVEEEDIISMKDDQTTLTSVSKLVHENCELPPGLRKLIEIHLTVDRKCRIRTQEEADMEFTANLPRPTYVLDPSRQPLFRTEEQRRRAEMEAHARKNEQRRRAAAFDYVIFLDVDGRISFLMLCN